MNAWYYDLVKGVIKANFNPNSRISRYNANTPAYNPVDKSDLVWARDRFDLLKGHTTEFCFDTGGFYEITGLGEISESTGPRSSATAVAGGGSAAGPLERVFEKKVRTVVQVFDVLRHTSQLHFARTFSTTTRLAVSVGLRVRMVTLLANRARKMLSSPAELPPPMTSTSLSR